MRKKKINKLLCGGLLCIFAALCLIIHNYLEENNAQQESQVVQQKLETEIAVQQKEINSGYMPEREQDDSTKEQVPSLKVDNRDYCGLLEIPALPLSIPVQSEFTTEGLKISPCRYAGWVDTGNLVLAGHNYKSHFGNLNQLKSGDEICFTTADGTLYIYTVSVVEILDANAVEEMLSGEWDLSLFTCTLSRTSRVTVRCKRSDED